MLCPRPLGRSAVSLSPLAFGSMRMTERALDDAEWEHLLRHSLERGVTTFHASSEYASHARFCAVFGRLDRRGTQVIVKLAEPHFGDAAFDEARFTAKLDPRVERIREPRAILHCIRSARSPQRADDRQARRAALRRRRVRRGEVHREARRARRRSSGCGAAISSTSRGRLAGFARQRDDIRAAFERARRAGKLGAVAPFPYTAGFCDATIDAGVDGIAVYLNPVERELVPQIARAHAAGIGTVAIRPLSAGKALAAASPVECIRSVLDEPGVASAVVTYSSPEHLAELVQAASEAR